MNSQVVLEVAMSVVFFAPVLIAFACFVVVGLFVAFEGMVKLAGPLSSYAGGAEPLTASPAPAGPIAMGLMEAVANDSRVAKTARTGGRDQDA